jgi:uncharacterized protein YyaL (SSP411 family)
MAEPKYTNALIHASSPYLLQHAHNPVNWIEWSNEVPAIARRADKLILLSIGYSSCHWCHVMEHVCFEQEDTAAIMNEKFICVKIDREERPDIDQVYMDAIQLISGRGGWPLNVFTLPDGRPLHGGTYFPKKEWEHVLLSLSKFYEEKREEAYEFATNLSNGIKKLDQFSVPSTQRNLFEVVKPLLHAWQKQFDLTLGGYNWSPKFPLPNQWELFTGIHYLTQDNTYSEAVQLTLEKMYEGGIYDHVGGGFARYSTDALWKVPHFEKMLYDNAQLMGTFAMAGKYFNNPLFFEVCEGIHQFLEQNFIAKDAGYYSALDADSEGEEGKYYVWEYADLHDLLEEKAEIFCASYSVQPNGNWEEAGNILHLSATQNELAEKFQVTVVQLQNTLNLCKKILLLERSKRIAPELDDKIICSWNALMVTGYAKAYMYSGNDTYLQKAENTLHFLLNNFVQNNQVIRIYKNGKASISGFAEDYACLIEALLYTFEVSSEASYLMKANELMEFCIEQFFDEASGLFFFSAQEHEVPVTRKLEVNDDVIPSSNSILAYCLYKLSYYFENPSYEEMYQNMLQTIAEKMEKFPNGFSNWMQLISKEHAGFTQVIVAGKEAKQWKLEYMRQFRFNTVVIELSGNNQEIPLLKGKEIPKDHTLAWVCKNKTCGLPLNNLQVLIEN